MHRTYIKSRFRSSTDFTFFLFCFREIQAFKKISQPLLQFFQRGIFSHTGGKESERRKWEEAVRRSTEAVLPQQGALQWEATGLVTGMLLG